ncbi:hypothetical protein KI387_006120, partial [Taxus chinensis]
SLGRSSESINMKIKFQGQEQISPLESAVSNIGDSEARHLDFGDFWSRMTDANPTPMAQMINDSGLAFAGGFPISVQCADTVLSCGAHFDPDSSELTNVHGELIAKLDAAAIGAALRIPEMDNAIVVSRDQAQAMFDQD